MPIEITITVRNTTDRLAFPHIEVNKFGFVSSKYEGGEPLFSLKDLEDCFIEARWGATNSPESMRHKSFNDFLEWRKERRKFEERISNE